MDDSDKIHCPAVDDDAYEPTYAEAFPPLPIPSLETGDTFVVEPPSSTSLGNAAVKRMALRSSVITQVFQVPVEEQKFNEVSEPQFGERGRDQAKICADIMSQTGVAIEMSMARDHSLTVVITGKIDGVRKARKMVVMRMQKQVIQSVRIPKEHHRFVLGQKGKRLIELELATSTKISVPRQDDPTDSITLTGTKEGIERARHEIQLISDEQAKLAFVRLPIPKEFHPFICGPNNQTLKDLQERTNARINIPPFSVMKNELTIAGEKEGVQVAEQEITKIYELKRQTCVTVSVEVKKSQHKYVIGPKGQNLGEILADYGVSVEVPPLDHPSETITLRGDADKLGIALTNIYAKANSISTRDVHVDGWLHRFIIGPKGSNIRQIAEDFPKVHIDFDHELNKITVEGPPEAVEKVVARINEHKMDLISRMAFVDLKVDSKYHGHIIGRNGANVARIKSLTGVSIQIPPDNSGSDIVRIEGTPEGVAQAKLEIINLVDKMDNEKMQDIVIDHRFHKAIIGQQGSKIKEIRELFSKVQISFPDPIKQSDIVNLRGPRTEVDRCYEYLRTVAQDMAANNYAVMVKVVKESIPKIIGKNGAQIRKIREETGTKIDLPRENSDTGVITITGKKENVEKARNAIEAIQKELASFSDITIDIPHKLHTSIIGSKGHLIREIMDDCTGVQIRFPSENSNSDKVHLRGHKPEVEKAKKLLLDLANDRIESHYTATVVAKAKYHGFLIGRSGASIREFRERTETRIVFPAANESDQDAITIIGKKENVCKAVAELEERIAALENKVERELSIDSRHHVHFVSRRGEVLRQIADDCGGVSMSFPRSGSKSDKVKLTGSKDCVELAIKRIEDIVADLEAQVTIECVVPQRHHGSIMGPRGQRVQDISKSHSVSIKIPERIVDVKDQDNKDQDNKDQQMQNGHVTNGTDDRSQNGYHSDTEKKDTNSAIAAASLRDVVLITGRKENCEAAKAAILELVPVVIDMEVSFEYHGQLIGQKGKEIRQIMDECGVTIIIPRPENHSNIIKISGPSSKIPHAQDVIRKRVHELEEERKQRELRSFRLEVEIPSKHHTKLIGRRGAVVNKLRADHDVQINFPDKDKGSQDTIIIIGIEQNAKNARDDIMKKVQELEDMFTKEVTIDSRIHARLIGARGRAISRMMEEFRVDIRMPGRDSSNPDLIVVEGREDDVLDCCDNLLNLEEEYLQDVTKNDTSKQVTAAYSDVKVAQPAGHHQLSKGFIVRDAPWSQTFTHSAEDFPNLAAMVTSSPSLVSAPGAVWSAKKL